VGERKDFRFPHILPLSWMPLLDAVGNVIHECKTHIPRFHIVGILEPFSFQTPNP
jgi:hypothetical protein